MLRLMRRGLRYYWRTHAAVVAGVATAVAVLGGALLIGDSVRGSLRDLVVQRLGGTDYVVAASGFFRERLADDLNSADPVVTGVVPIIALPGVVIDQESGRRVGQVRVYGVDSRFWSFHGVAPPQLTGGDALASSALAQELRASAGRRLLVRVQQPSEIPLESLHGRKENLGRSLRVTIRAVLPASAHGDFSLDLQQGDVRAIFISLAELQRNLDLAARVNTILISARTASGDATGAIERQLRARATLDDVGLTVTALDSRRAIDVSSQARLLDDAQLQATQAALAGTRLGSGPIFTYLANSLRHGAREIPYSLVTAVNSPTTIRPGQSVDQYPEPPIVLNEWASAELGARRGDVVTMEYFVWEEPGQLATRTADFRVADVVPVDPGDQDLVPVFPGINDATTLGNWDPPFPIELRRIRPADEEYWNKYRTTPKAFIHFEDGQRLWRSRYGGMTSLRIAVPEDTSLEAARNEYADRLRASIDPLTTGISVRNVRAAGLAASRGATDFGAYFVYFSFFIVVSAILLAALFFRLGVEQRSRELGLLRAVGFAPAAVRRLFVSEGLVLAAAGALVGVPAAIGYAALLIRGLRTWWVDAVGTDALTLHVFPTPLAAAALGGVAAALVSIWWTLRRLGEISERALLAGEIYKPQSPNSKTQGQDPKPRAQSPRPLTWPLLLAALAVALLGMSGAGMISAAGAFFGAGALLLSSALCLLAALFRRPSKRTLEGRGRNMISRLGWRNTTYRPVRSVVAVAVIASATFILIAVDAFRRGAGGAGDAHSGLGGYSVLVETLLPLVHDPNTPEGRRSLNLQALDSLQIEPFRVLPGDDTSCLNLYEPKNPRILAPRDSFLKSGRFAFQSSLATSDAERANPWLLLTRPQPDGAVPVIADANSMTYVLHRRLGEDIEVTRGARRIKLRFVAALRDSIFQSELLMAQARFLELFPEEEGYRLLLVETPAERASSTAAGLEDALTDLGADATLTAARLAEFHRVENSYLSAFQTLGGLGLLLGTVGLATVLLRNALERRRELALLGAVGYRRTHMLVMAAAENAVLLAAGLVAGALCAGLAIAPAIAERGGRLPLTGGAVVLIFAVFVAGLLSSLVAARAATRAPLLGALRSE